MKKISGIYKITSPSGKIYIGSSINICNRIKYYKCLDCKRQTRLYNSLLKYGWDNHTFEILEECGIEEMFKKETEYGMFYEVLGINGLNCTLPKNGDIKCYQSEETKLKKSLNQRGGKNNFFGKKHSEEALEKIRNAQLGRKHTLEHRMKVSKNHAKVNSKIVLNLETGVYYESCKEAALYNNYNHSTLKSKLNGSTKNNTKLIYA